MEIDTLAISNITQIGQGSHCHVVTKFPDFSRQLILDFPWPRRELFYLNEAKGSTINDLRRGGGGKIGNEFFFPEEVLLNFFSWRRASEIFFSRFPPPAPPPDH